MVKLIKTEIHGSISLQGAIGGANMHKNLKYLELLYSHTCRKENKCIIIMSLNP